MARSVILGNGRLTVGLNEKGLVHDFYYPYVGLENLTTARSTHHRIGVWVDDSFSWVDEQEWQSSVDFSDQALVAQVTLKNEKLGVEITTNDFVDYEYDAFCRILRVKNTSEHIKNIRIFMHQVFELSSNGRGDTALYVPAGHYILDYKGRCCLLIGGSNSNESFDQYAVGNYGIEGKEGTFKDAEDGELSGHNVEHGGVDSVVRFSLSLSPGESQQFDYWVAAAASQYFGEDIHRSLKAGLSNRLDQNLKYWHDWLAISDERTANMPEDQKSLVRKSLMTIKAHTDVRGGIIASCDSSIYNYGRDYYSYVWPRDGAYAIWPLIRCGYTEEAKNFFKFCADILTPDGYLMHKYQPDRAIGSTWHPLLHNNVSELAIQEDETATVLLMLGEYLQYSGDEPFVKDMYDRYVIKAANFMSSFIDESTGLPHASYDLWEEKFLTTTYTTATVIRALTVASELAIQFGDRQNAENWKLISDKLESNFSTFIQPENKILRKGYLLNQEDQALNYDDVLDVSSFYGVMMFNYSPEMHAAITATIEAIENNLMADIQAGGSPRYEYDNYFKVGPDAKPNPWLITTLWLAQYHIRTQNLERAEQLVQWVESKVLPSGVMPEQVHSGNGTPVSVTPLVWSHAEYINTCLDLAQKSQAN